jgi:hypothetical protein
LIVLDLDGLLLKSKKRLSHRATKNTEIKGGKVFGKEFEKEPLS